MSPNAKTTVVAVLLGVTLMAPAGWAQAQNLSVDETKKCLLDERELDQQKADLERRRPELARESQDLDTLKQRVEDAQNRVFIGATADPVARSEYEALRDRQFTEFDRHEAKQRDFNEDVTRYNQRLVSYNSRCGGSRYTDYNLREARRQLGW